MVATTASTRCVVCIGPSVSVTCESQIMLATCHHHENCQTLTRTKTEFCARMDEYGFFYRVSYRQIQSYLEGRYVALRKSVVIDLWPLLRSREAQLSTHMIAAYCSNTNHDFRATRVKKGALWTRGGSARHDAYLSKRSGYAVPCRRDGT